MPLAIERKDIEDTAVIAVRGELDIATAPELRAALMQAIEQHPGARLIADLEGLEFIDSAGLGILVGGRKRARTTGGDLVLVSTGRNVGRTLEPREDAHPTSTAPRDRRAGGIPLAHEEPAVGQVPREGVATPERLHVAHDAVLPHDGVRDATPR